MKDLIRKILKEELTPSVKRRIDFSNIDSIIKKHRLGAFQKEEPTELSMAVARTINKTMYDIMPDGFEDDDTKYYEVWDEIKEFLNNTYSEELIQYFEKRQRDSEDEEKNAPGVMYSFVKHDKPYYTNNWAGFSESFKSFNDMITKYGSWVNVDWDEVKKKLDDINEYPPSIYQDRQYSRPLAISKIGDEGNKWGYNFSVIKSIPNNTKGFQTEETHDELDEYSRTLKNARKQGSGLRFPKSAIKSNPLRFRPYNREMVDETNQELTEKCWSGYTQKGMKTMFGKRYPNCVKIKKK
jgi:hypothetical protein